MRMLYLKQGLSLNEVWNSILTFYRLSVYLYIDFCKGKQDGDYADPSNPSGYITCSKGITYKRSCVPGLVWNAEKKICDWPSNVKKYQSHDMTYQRPLPPQGPLVQKGIRIQVLK